MRVAYLGTSEFAATVLQRLADSPHRPVLVVTPPDRPRGRGRRVQKPPAALAAEELGIDLLQTPGVSEPESTERLLDAADVGTVCAFGQFIRDPLLSELELLNVHPSLLPRWRGAAPIERAIMAGDRETGVTIMRVTAGLDSGPIALQERTVIRDSETFAELSPRLAELGGELLVRALELNERSALRLVEQDDAVATYAAKLEAADRRLDPERPAAELERSVRALGEHVGVYLELEGEARLGVREARADDGELATGELVGADGALLLGCAEGLLRLAVVQPPGGRPMPADAYLRGHSVPRLAPATQGK